MAPKLREHVDANQSYGELHDILCDVVHEAGTLLGPSAHEVQELRRNAPGSGHFGSGIRGMNQDGHHSKCSDSWKCREGRRRGLAPKLREEVDANQSYGELHDYMEPAKSGQPKPQTWVEVAPQMQPRNESHWVRGRGVRLERRRRPLEPSKIGINIVIMARILPDAIQDCTYQRFNDTNKFEDIVEKLQTWFGNRNLIALAMPRCVGS